MWSHRNFAALKNMWSSVVPCLRTCDVDKRPSRPGTRVAPVGLGWLASRRLQCLALRVLNVTFRPFNRPMRKHLLLSGWSPRRPERRKPICKRSDDWDPSAVRLAYQRRFLLRQMSSTDLPTPAIPEGHDTKMCIYCSKVFPSGAKCGQHSLACECMPLPEWIRRIRICQYDSKDSDITCPHCGTGFATAKARGRHSTVCARRRKKAGLSLNSR